MAKRCYRLALIANPAFGTASYSWRIGEALLALGHTVFYFSPATHPELFPARGDMDEAAPDGSAHGSTVDLDRLARFLEVQRLDFVLLADGTSVSAGVRTLPLRPVIIACGARQLLQSLATLPITPVSVFAPASCAALCRPDDWFWPLEPAVDRGLVQANLANSVIYEHGPLLCLQNATAGRIGVLAGIRDALPHGAPAIRCFGTGWPDAWAGNTFSNDLLYALKSHAVLMRFDEPADTTNAANTDGPFDQEAAYCAMLCEACGGHVVAVGESTPTDLAAQVAACYGECPAPSPSPSTAPLIGQPTEPGANYLEDRLEAALADLANKEAELMGTAPGREDPRVIVTVLGYFGMGNFGDEYILSLIDRRLRERYPGASVVVVGENRSHTLEHRGLYAIGLSDKRALDCALAHSSAALVVAGLLFDQGIRWSMGRGELISSPRHTTIPGIASYTLLASLNNTPSVFYGIGAGPLDIAAGRDMVALCGRVGATFIARDQQTADLLLACGVDKAQVHSKADTAFLGAGDKPIRYAQVDAWLERVGFDPSCHRIVAVSLRDYEGLPPDFTGRVARALDAIQVTHTDVRFAFCLLDPADEQLSSQVIEQMESARCAALFDAHDTIEQFDDLLSRVYAGLSMRYHCSLLINRSGMPCVGINYLPKVASLYHDTGCGNLLLGLDATAPDIERSLVSALDEHAAWCATIGEHTADLCALSSQAEELLYAVIDRTWPSKQERMNDELFYEHASADIRDARIAEQQLMRERQRTRDLEARIASLDDELHCIKQSVSFRLGRAMTSMLRTIRDKLRR